MKSELPSGLKHSAPPEADTCCGSECPWIKTARQTDRLPEAPSPGPWLQGSFGRRVGHMPAEDWLVRGAAVLKSESTPPQSKPFTPPSTSSVLNALRAATPPLDQSPRLPCYDSSQTPWATEGGRVCPGAPGNPNPRSGDERGRTGSTRPWGWWEAGLCGRSSTPLSG